MKSKLLPNGLYRAMFTRTTHNSYGRLAVWTLEKHNQQVFDHIFTQNKKDFYKGHDVGDIAVLSIKQILLSDGSTINNIIYSVWEEKMVESKAAKDLVRLVRGIVQEELDIQRNPDEDDGDRAGSPWSNAEDKQLTEEVALAVHVIAVVHKRKYGGITSRIQQLMKNGTLRI